MERMGVSVRVSWGEGKREHVAVKFTPSMSFESIIITHAL